MTGPVEALIVVSVLCAAQGSLLLAWAVRRTLLSLPRFRAARQRAAHRRVINGFPHLSTRRRAFREVQLMLTPHGCLRDARVLRMRLVNSLERAGTSARVLVHMDRVDPQMAVLVKRLRDLGVRLDRRLQVIEALGDPRLQVPELTSTAASVHEVERMSGALGALAAALAGGTIDLEAAQLRRELEAEVNALRAGLRAYRDFESSLTEPAPTVVAH
jgi:hypothetical protein